MKIYVIIFLVFAVVGPVLEWCYGKLWSITGSSPWVYPNSILEHTSFEGIPLWGFGGLIGFSIYRAILDRSLKRLLGAIIPLLLAVIWILLYSSLTA